MRTNIPLLAIVAAVLLAPAAALAQDVNSDQPNRPNRAERRQRIIAAFDADGDGRLNDEERAKAREELGGLGNRSDRPRAARQGSGPRPMGPPDPNRIFDRFDENGDNQLSREEFAKLTEAMRQMRQRRGGGPPEGRGRARPDDRPAPPPEEGERPPRRRRGLEDGQGFGPLENPGPPPRAEEQGYRGPRGDRGARGGRGLEGRGPERMGPPNPERLFNAFDANGDNQLSREEFAKLTEAMRERMGGMRNRGLGPGPPEGGRGRFRNFDDPDAPPGPPRPPRPEFEGADSPDLGPDANSA